jgi:cysteine-rich repeat protein
MREPAVVSRPAVTRLSLRPSRHASEEAGAIAAGPGGVDGVGGGEGGLGCEAPPGVVRISRGAGERGDGHLAGADVAAAHGVGGAPGGPRAPVVGSHAGRIVGARVDGCKGLIDCRLMRIVAAAAALLVAGCLEESDRFMKMDESTGMPPDETSSGMPPPPTTEPEPDTTTTGAEETSGPETTTTLVSTTTEPDETMGDTESPQPPTCGDGEPDPGEVCDDGNADNNDACLSNCVQATCGDGVLRTEGMKEACDDGNSDETDACVLCKDAKCGDGFVQAGVETCDDGDGENGDGCDNNCKPSLPLFIFVTSGKWQGNLEGLSGADEKCKTAAIAGGLPNATYKAWLSDHATAARDRIVHGKVAYVRRDGMVLADDWDDLMLNGVEMPVMLDEKGMALIPTDEVCMPDISLAWTNTNSNGTTYDPDYDCDGWSKTMGPAAFGATSGVDFQWSLECGVFLMSACSKFMPLYCMQEPEL